ncbi:MAG: carboxylating nicotinate-nucleotide diphosphorylase [Verrucomicrobia bacterium]|nr:carboxylating nicotinate-nucleotide diphosphorylase [Verrucomicrobiota bacterium]
MEAPDPVKIALAEDIGTGDLTSNFFVPASHRSLGRVFAKEPAVIAGLDTAIAVLGQVDPRLEVERKVTNGDRVTAGDTILTATGATRSLLTAERVMLNFLQRLSGIATLTRKFVDAVAGTGVSILDTRKTTPGLRALEKAAVVAGGGRNHRFGLYDAVVVKDNHLLANSDLAEGLGRLRAQHPNKLIELEADTIEQVERFVRYPEVNVILLDNMTPTEMSECLKLGRSGLQFEASGGINLETVRAIAETGVDFISVGQLTHSAPAVDLSFEITSLSQ